jgi:hypothetical protein
MSVKDPLSSYYGRMRKTINKVSKLDTNNIDIELNRLERMNIPEYEKRIVKENLYGKLSTYKKKLLFSHFGDALPMATPTIAPVAAVAAPVAVVAAPTPVAPTLAPPVPVAPVPVAPVPVAPVPVAPVATPQQPTQLAGSIPMGGGYATSAGAVAAAANALAQVGAALTAQNAVSGNSGFGNGFGNGWQYNTRKSNTRKSNTRKSNTRKSNTRKNKS